MPKLSVIPREVDIETVDLLEELLTKAKAGEIRELVVVCNVSDDEGGYFRYSAFSDRWRLLGALEYAKHAVQAG